MCAVQFNLNNVNRTLTLTLCRSGDSASGHFWNLTSIIARIHGSCLVARQTFMSLWIKTTKQYPEREKVSLLPKWVIYQVFLRLLSSQKEGDSDVCFSFTFDDFLHVCKEYLQSGKHIYSEQPLVDRALFHDDFLQWWTHLVDSTTDPRLSFR